jgi:hypothetical protein
VEEGRGRGGGRAEDSVWSLAYVIIICIDVTRASLDKIGQNVLTRHFLASLHVCDTIEGLRLVYYDWFFDLTSVCIKSTSVLY